MQLFRLFEITLGHTTVKSKVSFPEAGESGRCLTILHFNLSCWAVGKVNVFIVKL